MFRLETDYRLFILLRHLSTRVNRADSGPAAFGLIE
ncbi:hypothetical protein M673_04280 [Aureimonas sp. AU20]|nr:hypothetical protein M673_04280 [Aureimonas sp. AU20]